MIRLVLRGRPQLLRPLLLLLPLLLPGTTAAAEPLTLEAALARADEVSTDVQMQALSTEAAEAAWRADPRAGAPSIRVGLRDIDTSPTIPGIARDPVEVVARVRFPFPRPWDLAGAARQGAATQIREDAQLEVLRAELRLAVTTRFHALPLLRDAVAAATRRTELRTQHLELVAQRREEGLATALDWLESEEDRRDADDARAAREADLRQVEAELRALLRWPADEPLELVPVDLSAVEAGLPALDELAAGVEERSPRLREAEAEITRAEARLRRLQLRSLPWIDWAQGGLVHRADRPLNVEVGIGIDIPIYLWSPARTRAAAHELAGAKLSLAAAEHAVAAQVARRHRDAEAARERWLVERAHHEAVAEQAAPLLEVADPVLRTELEARLARAELRALLAFVELVEEVDRLEAAAGR